MYLITTSSTLEGAPEQIGVIIGPRVGGMRPIHEGRKWAADNDAFHGKFTPDGFETHLARLAPHRFTCLFVTCPDVRLDAEATLQMFGMWSPIIREAGFPVAYVAQDGSEHLPIPEADALFIGGGDPWRERHTATMTARAKEKGMWVHVGRVNSAVRLVACAEVGADSADGTYNRFKGLPQTLIDVTEWLAQSAARRSHPSLEIA